MKGTPVIITQNPRLCLLGFNHVRGIGAVRLQNLINAFGDAESAWRAPAGALRDAGLSEKLVQSLVETRNHLDLESVWESLERQGIQIITWDDEDYPRRLREIAQPPPVLYVRGDILTDDDWAVAVVGTRRITSYGRRAAEDIASALAQRHVTVVSGLARGVDSIAHQAALNGGGRTLAVLGSGVDRIYPPEHRRLAEEICECGALISDYPPGSEPDAANFPARNRIISGLALAVVVVEAGLTSGALITAKFAADQGRDVFAVPGSIYSSSSKGTNNLIRDGAYPVLEAGDILSVLGLEKAADFQSARSILPENAAETKLLSLLDNEPTHMDDIQTRSGLPIDEVSATLALMELKGMVQQVGRMNYILRDSG